MICEMGAVSVSYGAFQMPVTAGVGIREVWGEFVVLVTVVLSHSGFSVRKFLAKYNIALPLYLPYF